MLKSHRIQFELNSDLCNLFTLLWWTDFIFLDIWLFLVVLGTYSNICLQISLRIERRFLDPRHLMLGLKGIFETFNFSCSLFVCKCKPKIFQQASAYRYTLKNENLSRAKSLLLSRSNSFFTFIFSNQSDIISVNSEQNILSTTKKSSTKENFLQNFKHFLNLFFIFQTFILAIFTIIERRFKSTRYHIFLNDDCFVIVANLWKEDD